MAKSQRRSSREIRKPKAAKAKPSPLAAIQAIVPLVGQYKSPKGKP